jgi:hypothetical protein
MKIRNLMFSALVLGAIASAPAFAGPAIDWDPAYVYGPGAAVGVVPPGSELRGVGIVSLFDGPLGFLDANDPNKEYTFVFRGLISQPTQVVGPPATTFYTTNYTGGIFELWEGSPRNSSFAPFPENAIVPSTFQDGTLLLAGQFTSFYVQTNNFTLAQSGNMEGNILWTSGSLLPLLNNGSGEPCPGLFTGGITWSTQPGVGIPGYTFRHDGKIDLNCPVPAEPSTWGKLKAQYRD